MKYAHALVRGRFYPPHAGHHLLLYKASQVANHLTVFVEDIGGEALRADRRIGWLRAVHPQGHVEFVEKLPELPPQTVIVSPGPKSAALSRTLGLSYAPLESVREKLPLSSEQIRANLPAFWNRIAPAVRKALAVRVVVAGPPQSGKTALAMALAQKFRMWPGAWQLTAVSPSYAPMFAAEKAEQGRTDWSQDDCLHAAAMQLAMDGEAASDSAPLLLCDSSLPTIAAHYQHRWGCSNPHLETLLSDFPPALLLITRPYENPGADAWLIPRLEDLAQQSGIATQVLSGAPPERFDKAWRDLQQLVAQSWQF